MYIWSSTASSLNWSDTNSSYTESILRLRLFIIIVVIIIFTRVIFYCVPPCIVQRRVPLGFRDCLPSFFFFRRYFDEFCTRGSNFSWGSSLCVINFWIPSLFRNFPVYWCLGGNNISNSSRPINLRKLILYCT